MQHLQGFVLGIADGGRSVHCRSRNIHVRHRSNPGGSVYNTDGFVRLDSLYVPNQTRLLESRIRVSVCFSRFFSVLIFHLFLYFADYSLRSGASSLEV